MKQRTPMLLSAIVAVSTLLACRDSITGLAPESLRTDLSTAGPVVVSPGNMHGWQFRDDQRDTACSDATTCRMVDGPSGTPAGTGSAELAVSTTSEGKALILADYLGTRFDSFTELRYSTYRQTADAGNNLAIALQVNVDYDLTDQFTGYQGRLVFEPYQSAGGGVPVNTWQTWDARAGKWWGTRASVTRAGVAVTNPCVQATPCTWAQLLAAFPDVGVHSIYGAIVLKAGSGWTGFRGNVDALTIGVSGVSTGFDFELNASSPVTLIPPDSTPRALFDSLGTVVSPDFPKDSVIRDILIVRFAPLTPLALRQAAIDAVQGQVIGGRRDANGQDGSYYVRVSGGTHESLVAAALILQRMPQVTLAMRWHIGDPDVTSYRRPKDGEGWNTWVIDPAIANAARPNWALEYVRAPMAWGCSTGGQGTAVGVVDTAIPLDSNLAGNVDRSASLIRNDWDQTDFKDWSTGKSFKDHGSRVASVLAAVGNDGYGMTGMAWRARLLLEDANAPAGPTDYRSTPERIRDGMVFAAEKGATVINVSLGVKWNSLPYDTANHSQMERVNEASGQVIDAITWLAKNDGAYPLFVIAAGNEERPFQAAGYPGAKDRFPEQVLVVGGLGSDGRPWIHSNTGGDIYAPAENVRQATASNLILGVEAGTSFSAPLVAGAAVLLKDFDPSLTSVQIRDLIINGARLEDGVRKLDAYGSLKLAAERIGAPLCGNRVFKANDVIVAMRGGGALDPIIPLPHETPDSNNAVVDVYHGGKRVDLAYQFEYDWNSGSRRFERAPSRTYDSSHPDGGMFRSASATSHDYEVTALPYLLWSYDEVPYRVIAPELQVYRDGASDPIHLPIASIPVARPTTMEVVGQVPAVDDYGLTYQGYFVPADTIYVGSWQQPRFSDPVVAVAPSGKYALVAINWITRENSVTSDFRQCRAGHEYDVPGAQCKDGGRRTQSFQTVVYRVNLIGDPTVVADTVIAGAEMAWMAISEKEDEVSWQTVSRFQNADVRWTFQSDHVSYDGNVDSVYDMVTTCSGKSIEYLAFDSSGTAAHPIGGRRINRIAVADGCNDSYSQYAGTISPSRSPTMPSLSPARAATPIDRRAKRGRRPLSPRVPLAAPQ